MEKNVSQWVYYPLLWLIVGFILVKSQAVIGFADFQWIYVLGFGLFGLMLAFIHQSRLPQRYKSWLKGFLYFGILFFIIGFLFWNSMTNGQENWSMPEEQTSAFLVNKETSSMFELESVRFWYPNTFELEGERSKGVVLKSAEKIPWGTEEMSKRIYSIYESQTEERDFDTFADKSAQTTHGYAEDFGLTEEPVIVGTGTEKLWFVTPTVERPQYEIKTDLINGIPVLIEQRNFDSMCGNVLEAIFWLGEGRLVHFYTDCNNTGEYPYMTSVEEINQIIGTFERR